MVAVDVDGGHELIEQGAAFGVGGGFPDGVPVDLVEQFEDLFAVGIPGCLPWRATC